MAPSKPREHRDLALFAGKERLLHILSPVCGGLMWRNSMADVADDLGLPPQHQRKTDLQLSAIERHFYTRQHQACNPLALSFWPHAARFGTHCYDFLAHVVIVAGVEPT